MDDFELLKAYGWEVESCERLEIRHKETKGCAIGDLAVKLIIEALRARRNEYEEQVRRLDAFGRL